MSQMKEKHNSKVLKFILFNTSWGEREGSEQDKILYHLKRRTPSGAGAAHGARTGASPLASEGLGKGKDSSHGSNPSVDSLDSIHEELQLQGQIKDIGLCEALIHFVKNFGASQEIEAVHGSKSRLVLHQVETNYWMAMSLSVPRSVLKTGGMRSKDGQGYDQIVEYEDEELSDYLVRLVIKQIYQAFFLLNGHFEEIWTNLCDGNRDKIRQICSQFFDWYLPSIRIAPVNMLELFGAIQYLPLDNHLFMSAQSFVNHLMFSELNSVVAHLLLLYNDQLISSSMDLTNTKVIYKYLVSLVIPEAVCGEINEPVKSKSAQRTRFVKKNVRVFLKDSPPDGHSSLLMSVYRSINGATVVLLLSQESEPTLAKCDAFMSTRLPELATKLGQVSVKITTFDNNIAYSGSSPTASSSASLSDPSQNELFKFVYYNGSNSAFKSNSGTSGLLDHRKISDSEFVRLIVDLESDLRTILSTPRTKVSSKNSDKYMADNVVEIVAKTTNESWLICHDSDSRTLFSLLNHKNSNLVEAKDTVSLLLEKQFKNILFID